MRIRNCKLHCLMVATDQQQELGKANFVIVTIDASNMKEIIFVLIVVCYLVPDIGENEKLFKFKSLPLKLSTQ